MARGDKLLFKDLTYQIRGILFLVHNELGRFRNEKQYGNAFEQKLKDEKIDYERENFVTKLFRRKKR